jgi:cytoskeletal protein RodZ
MKKRSHVETSRTISRILVFIFSAIVAYFLWSYLRPRFVSPEAAEPCSQSLQEAQTTGASPQEALSQDLAPQTLTTDISAAPPTITKANEQIPAAIAQEQQAATPTNSTEPQPVVKNPIATQPISKNTLVAEASKNIKNLPANRTITLHNGIEKKMLGYKKFGTHYPTAFKITVGNTVVQEGDNVNAAVKNNILMVRYDFEFMNGYRRGAREVTIELQPNADVITLAFNWKQHDHLVIAEADNVTSMIEKDVPYQA